MKELILLWIIVPRATGENVCVINILQNKTSFLCFVDEKVGKVLQTKVDTKASGIYLTPNKKLLPQLLDLVTKFLQIASEKIIATLHLVDELFLPILC